MRRSTLGGWGIGHRRDQCFMLVSSERFGSGIISAAVLVGLYW